MRIPRSSSVVELCFGGRNIVFHTRYFFLQNVRIYNCVAELEFANSTKDKIMSVYSVQCAKIFAKLYKIAKL